MGTEKLTLWENFAGASVGEGWEERLCMGGGEGGQVGEGKGRVRGRQSTL